MLSKRNNVLYLYSDKKMSVEQISSALKLPRQLVNIWIKDEAKRKKLGLGKKMRVRKSFDFWAYASKNPV